MPQLINKHLYEIADSFKDIYQMIDDNELSEEDVADHIEALDIEFKLKAEQVALVIKNLTPMQDYAKQESDRLKERSASLKAKQEWLKIYLVNCMAKVGETKIKGDLLTITSCQGKEYPKIDNEEELPDEHVKYEVVSKIDKKGLLKSLQEERAAIEENPDYDADNELIKGAHIERADNYLRIS